MMESFCNSPQPEMPDVRLNLNDAFEKEDPKQSDNMSVYARIRPMLQREEDAGYKQCIAAIDDVTVRAVFPKSSLKFKNNKEESVVDFTYSRAFGPETGQFIFFEETIMKTMQSFIDGQNSLIFSYGITNSGKTYTLQGNEENPGVIILALRLFFSAIEHQLLETFSAKPDKFSDLNSLEESDVIKEIAIKEDLMKFYNQEVVHKSAESSSISKSFAMKLCDYFSDRYEDQGDIMTTLPIEEMEAGQCAAVMKRLSKETADRQSGKCNIWISFIEIYNEYIYDLLQPNVFPRKKLQLAEDLNGDVYVKGAKEVYVANVEEALKLLHIGRKSLRIACTKLNYQSSRSHCIYIVKVVRLSYDSDSFRINRLAFCDLAGSERASKSDTSGMRLKEAGYINTSLLVLGRCLEQLRQNQNSRDKKLIPFRESKLTRLFSGHFMGKGNAVMIANASPCEYTFDETLNVLKFSAVAKELILNDTYMKMASSSLQSISSQWSQCRAQSSSFTLDQSSDIENSLLEDIHQKDELIEKLLELADSLRNNLEEEKKEKFNLEYSIRQKVCEEYSKYTDELLDKQEKRYDSLLEDLREQHKKRLAEIEKIKDEQIRLLREELDASTDESFQSVDTSITSNFQCKTETPVKAEVSFKDHPKTDAPLKCDHIPEIERLSADLFSLNEDLNLVTSERDSAKEELEQMSQLLQEYEGKLISLKESLNVITAERDEAKEKLDQMSKLFEESEMNKSSTDDKCLQLESKLQESCNVLEQFEKEVALLRSEMSVAENKIAEVTEEKQRLQETVFSLSEELTSSSELIEKMKNEKLEIENTLTTSLESLKASSSELIEKLKNEKLELENSFASSAEVLKGANEKHDDLSKKLYDATETIEQQKAKIFALESECDANKKGATKLFDKCKSLEEEIALVSQNLEALNSQKEAAEKVNADLVNSLKSDLVSSEKKFSEIKLKLEETDGVAETKDATYNQLKEEYTCLQQKFALLENKLSSLEDIHGQKCNLELTDLKQKLNDAHKSLEEQEIFVSTLRSENTNLTKDIETLKIELDSKLEDSLNSEAEISFGPKDKELDDFKMQLSEKEKECETLNNKCNSLLVKQQELEVEIVALTKDLASSSELIEKLKKEKLELESRIETSGENLIAEKNYDELSKKLNDATQTIEEQKTKIFDLESDRDANKNEVCSLFDKCKSLEEEIKLVTQNSETLKSQKEAAKKIGDGLISSLKSDLVNSERQHSETKLKLEEAVALATSRETACNQLKEEHTSLQQKFALLENKLSSLEDIHGEKCNLELTDLKQKLSDAQKSLEEQEIFVSTLKSEYAKLTHDNESLKIEIDRKSESMHSEAEISFGAGDKKELDDLKMQLSEKEKEYETLNNKYNDLENKIAALTKDLESAYNDREVYENEKAAATEALESLKTDFQNVSDTLTQKENDLVSLKNECTLYREEILGLKKSEGDLKDKSKDLMNKLDAANIELSDLKTKLLALESELTDMQTVGEEKKLLEEKYSSLIENNTVAEEKVNLLQKELEEKLKSLNDCAELIKVLELSELKASDKIKYLNDVIATHMNNISDMERQIREKETAISELEKALEESQHRVQEMNTENQKLLKQRMGNSYEEKPKKKTTATKMKIECDDKENSDKSESFKDVKLKRSSSTTSEEGQEVRKTRRALRTRQATSVVTEHEDVCNISKDDIDEKPRTVSRKRKSDEEFLPTKKSQKETSKLRKIPSRQMLKDKKTQNGNMSPAQKVAAFVGSTIQRVANSVTSIPSPRMTRGRKKLFNTEAASSPNKKNWKY